VTQTYTKLSSSRSSKTNTPPKESSEDKDENETTHIMYFIHAQTLPPTMLSFDQLNEKSFVIRLDHSFRITYCEEQLTILLGYKLKEVVGKSLYHFIHPNDLNQLKKCHQQTLNKTQARILAYRWLLNQGRCAWLQSNFASNIDKNIANDEQIFICLSHLISLTTNQVPDNFETKKSEELKTPSNTFKDLETQKTDKNEKTFQKAKEEVIESAPSPKKLRRCRDDDVTSCTDTKSSSTHSSPSTPIDPDDCVIETVRYIATQ